MKTHLKSTLLIVGIFALVGCGGGGGGGGGKNNDGNGSSPTSPQGLRVSPGDSTNMVAWNDVAEATSYNLYFGDNNAIDMDSANLFRNVQSPMSHDNLINNQEVFYFVTSVNDDGESSPSATASGIPTSGKGGGGGGGGGGNSGPDPFFPAQWHLENVGQLGAVPGEDARVLPVWDKGLYGQTTLISIVDDGLDINHEDLIANVLPGGSINYVDGSNDPSGGSHGTCCGGVSAARGGNGIGVSGAAPLAGLVGYNFLANQSSETLVDAMTRNGENVSVSNNSWGPNSNGVLAPSESTWMDSIVWGLNNGRNGLGTIYMFASGNSADLNGQTFDNANYDGYLTFPGVLAIGAVGDDGVRANYSEFGANLWICAHSQGNSQQAITTVDRAGTEGYNDGSSGTDYANIDYTNTFNGTSSATPLASGVVALMLEANPNLTWRDVRIILAKSARKTDLNNPGWSVNGAGYPINHEYGFGVVDANAAISLAQSWTNVGSFLNYESAISTPGLPIPDADTNGVSDSIQVSGSGINKIEYMNIRFSAPDHTWSSDLLIILTNPSGQTISVLAEPHASDTPVPHNNWYFASVRHLDESADGNWTLSVYDLGAQDTGTFAEWQMTFYGRQ